MLRCADPVPPLKPEAVAIMVLVLTKKLVPNLWRSEGEKLITVPMLSQYPTIGHMAKAHRENPHHLARITLRMEDTIKSKLLPAIRLICHHQSTRHSKSLKEELSYMGTKARGDKAMMRSAEMNRHNEKLAMMADPGKGNKPIIFVITYLLEDEQELSLGMLDMLQTYL
jgi:hypothetical protein